MALRARLRPGAENAGKCQRVGRFFSSRSQRGVRLLGKLRQAPPRILHDHSNMQLVPPLLTLFNRAVLLGALATAPVVVAAPTAPSGAQVHSRPVTAAEQAGFAAYYQRAYPDAPLVAAPRLLASRASASAPWTVAATVDAPPVHGAGLLCRMQRSSFVLGKRWQPQDGPRQLVWLERGVCRVPAQPVELLQRIPDLDVIPLLAGAAAMLPRARLVMAGNSSCAAARSFPFALAALDVAPLPSGPEQLPVLEYQSDRGAVARIWVRTSAAGLDAWNVSCSGAPG
jgi:hypothetical protein